MSTTMLPMKYDELTARRMIKFIRSRPEYLYAHEDDTIKFVFKDRVCLGLEEAYSYARYLEDAKGS